MTAKMFSDRLLASAGALKWKTSVVSDFTAQQFRGRTEATEKSLPTDAIGLRLGDYPVLVASIKLGNLVDIQASLRSLHTQMVIARSYMAAHEVINAHIMLFAQHVEASEDWRRSLDLTERDETVCRKLIWMPTPTELETSYAQFIARTFLARPWESASTVESAPLDRNQGLLLRTLERHGLSSETAAKWISLVNQNHDDPDNLVVSMTTARELS